MNFKKLKEPQSKDVLAKKPQRGRPHSATSKITAHIRLGITEAEKEKIIEIAAERGLRSYSQTVRLLLKEAGHI